MQLIVNDSNLVEVWSLAKLLTDDRPLIQESVEGAVMQLRSSVEQTPEELYLHNVRQC